MDREKRQALRDRVARRKGKKPNGLERAARRYWRDVIAGKKVAGGDEISSAEQRAYASLMNVAMKTGLIAMLGCFLIYISGALNPHVPLNELPEYWSLPVDKYLAKTGLDAGWGWAHHIRKGDYLNVLPVVFLSSITVICYIRILPILLTKRERVLSAIVVAEVIVLGLAASGLLAGGH